MARKVFISVLGASNYGGCYYTKDDKGFKSSLVRYIQEATIEYLMKEEEWTSNDVAYILLTEESELKNWKDNGHKDFTTKETINQTGLLTQLQQMNLPFEVETIDKLPMGNNEKEIWEIFEKTFEKIQVGDELYFDLTHGFRYIPMLILVLGNYSKFMKKVVVRSITYGNFEGRDRKTNEAPIIDLLPLSALQEYTDIASSFTSFGRVKKLSDALKTENTDSNAVIKEIYTALENFDNALVTNRLSEIKEGKYMLVIKNSIKPLNKQKIPTPIKLIISRIYKELEDFGFTSENSSQNIEAAINWLKHYKMLAQAYTTGQEYIISLVVDIFKDENPYKISNTEEIDKKKRKELEKKSEKNFRMYMSSICSISDKDVANEDFRHALLEHKELTRKLLSNPTINSLRKYFAELGENRNAINHGKGNVTYSELENEFNKLFSNCLEIIK